MELDKFEILSFAARLDSHCEAVTGGDFWICGVFEELADAAGCEDYVVGEDIFDFVFAYDLSAVAGFSFGD